MEIGEEVLAVDSEPLGRIDHFLEAQDAEIVVVPEDLRSATGLGPAAVHGTAFDAAKQLNSSVIKLHVGFAHTTRMAQEMDEASLRKCLQHRLHVFDAPHIAGALLHERAWCDPGAEFAMDVHRRAVLARGHPAPGHIDRFDRLLAGIDLRNKPVHPHVQPGQIVEVPHRTCAKQIEFRRAKKLGMLTEDPADERGERPRRSQQEDGLWKAVAGHQSNVASVAPPTSPPPITARCRLPRFESNRH